MGLLDLFSKDKRDERARTKNIERANNKYAQSGDRLKALEALAADESVEALYGMLRRFSLMYDKTIEDEQEKEWVFETLVSKGKTALPAVRKYLLSADSISWPLRLLDTIASKEEEIAAIEEIIARHEPGYERDPSKKIQMLSHLGGLKHPKAPGLVAPYLKDMDEGVRFTAVEALLRQKNEEVAREPLLELFVSDAEESLRIRLRICEGFAELGWLVHGHRGGVEKKLPDAYLLDREGHIKKKPQG
jgi:HEAT repeat protein